MKGRRREAMPFFVFVGYTDIGLQIYGLSIVGMKITRVIYNENGYIVTICTVQPLFIRCEVITC